MICPNCGLDAPNEANFCPRCGKPISPQGEANAPEDPRKDSLTTPPGTGSARTPTGNYVFSGPPDEADEVVFWDEYPSMRTAIPGIVISVLIGTTIIIALQVIPFSGSGIIQIVISAIVLLLVLGDILRHWIRLHSIKYRLTSQRLFVTHGLINKRTDEVELEKYKDIFVNQDFWDNIVGCGDIEVVTSDVSHPTIRIIDVVDPIGKKESIRTAARQRKSILGIARREDL